MYARREPVRKWILAAGAVGRLLLIIVVRLTETTTEMTKRREIVRFIASYTRFIFV